MKACLLKAQESVNPLYLASADPDKQGIVPILVVPAGTVIDAPDSYLLCALDLASPEDDECRAATLNFLGSAKRKKLLAQIRSLQQADGVQKLDPTTKKWLDYMSKAYASELGLEPAE